MKVGYMYRIKRVIPLNASSSLKDLILNHLFPFPICKISLMRVKTVGDLVLNEDAVISVQQLTPKIVLSVGVSFFFFLICGGKSFCRSHTDCVLL